MRSFHLRNWISKHYDHLGLAYIFLFSVAIIFRPYTAPGQLLIIDSDLYMEIASFVLDGTFWERFQKGDPVLYWYWPMGYPVVLGLLAKILGGDLFLAGRVLNLMAFFGIVFLLTKMFPKHWSFYLFLIGTASFLGLFTSTLTEASFLAFGFGLVFFVLKEDKKWLPIVFFSVLLFLFRYIGLFSLVFLTVYLLMTRDRKLLVSIVVVLIISALYIIHLKSVTGNLPTFIIQPRTVSTLGLLKQIFVAFWANFSYFEVANWIGKIGWLLFLIGIIPFGYFLYKLLGNREKASSNNESREVMVFALFGISYFLMFFFIVFVLGWDHEGYGISSRYIVPGAVFLWIALFHYYIRNLGLSDSFKLLAGASAWISLLYNGYFQSVIDYIKFFNV